MSAPRHEFYCFTVPPSKRYLLPSPLWITANFPEEISNLINLISRGREIKKMGRLQVSKRLNFSKGKMKKFRILQLCFNYSSLEKLKNLSRFYCYDSFSSFSPLRVLSEVWANKISVQKNFPEIGNSPGIPFNTRRVSLAKFRELNLNENSPLKNGNK